MLPVPGRKVFLENKYSRYVEYLQYFGRRYCEYFEHSECFGPLYFRIYTFGYFHTHSQYFRFDTVVTPCTWIVILHNNFRPTIMQLNLHSVEKVPFNTFAWSFVPKMLESNWSSSPPKSRISSKIYPEIRCFPLLEGPSLRKSLSHFSCNC